MDQKSQIIDEQTTQHISIQQIETNFNTNNYSSYNNSFTNFQQHNMMQNQQNNQLLQHNQHQTSQNQFYNQQQSNQKLSKQQKTQQNNGVNQFMYQPKKSQLDLQKFAICLQSIQYSLTRIFYRNFHNKLISFYIQSLKEQQRKQRQTKQIEIKLLKQQNWPFKQLFYKKYRNQNQQIMFEFINMCAQKIQASFKGYIIQKRHKQAFHKINLFKTKLRAILIGWKTWNTFNCKKIQQIRKTAFAISKQIDAEIYNPNIDRFKKMKKIQYLNSSHQVVKQNFIKSFQNLYLSGAWIYQVDKCFKKPIKQGHPHHISHSYYPNQQQSIHNSSTIKHTLQNNQIQELKPKTRKRQFQAASTKNANKQLSNISTKLNKESYQNQFMEQKSITSTNYHSSQIEQRPIMAKGKYQLTEEDIKNNENQFLKMNDYQSKDQNNHESNQQNLSPRINKFREDQKKKLAKRHKYDPRKAIQQEKKRIQEQKKKKLQKPEDIVQNYIQTKSVQKKKKTQKKVNQISKKTPRISKKQEQRRQLQSPNESSKQKTVQKVKKENQLTKKGDNSKSIKQIISHKNIKSKVDCWGPKKDSSQTNIVIPQDISYKSKYLIGMKQKNQQKASQIANLKRGNNSKKYIKQQKYIPNYQQEDSQSNNQIVQIVNQYQYKKQKIQNQSQQQQTYQSSYLKKLVQQRQKGTFSYANKKLPYGIKKGNQKATQRKQQTFTQKFQELNNNIKKLSQNRTSITNLKNLSQQRKVILHQNSEAQIQKKKQEVHRTIQSLEDVYSTQYTDRLNNLKTKLNMLQSTRYIQRDDSIPILLQDSKFIKKMYKDHAFSSLYWPQVRTMETNFLDYIKFSGF